MAKLSILSTILCLCLTAFQINAFSMSNTKIITPSSPSSSSHSTELQMTVLTYNGKKQNFKAGSPLKNAVGKLGYKPKYSCKKGDCGSCTISIAGSRVKACVGKVPPEPRLKSLQEKGLELR